MPDSNPTYGLACHSAKRSFGTPVTTFDRLMDALTEYAMRAGEKLRHHGLVAARLTAFFHTNRHKPDRPQYAGSRMVTLHPMTNDCLELIAAARRRGGRPSERGGMATPIPRPVSCWMILSLPTCDRGRCSRRTRTNAHG